jgi:NAD(P)-dependent dehydrogenase (short-subunit alcohol dehydrogenase family)
MTMNPMDLAGRSILVTGASSGIGRETALLLSQLNARVVLAARNQERLDETLRSLQGEGHVVAPFDLRAIEGIPEWFNSVAASAGPLHGLVHSAGIATILPLHAITPAKLDDLMRVNFTAGFMLARALRRRGCAAPDASVVFVSSVAAFRSDAGQSIYSASKAALGGLTKALAVELAPQRIRVNCVAPGFVESEMLEQSRQIWTPEQFQAVQAAHPLGLGAVRDVAHAIAFLLADTGRWITGTTLIVDGGYSAH